MIKIPQRIEGDRIYLKPLAEEDFELFRSIYTDPKLMKYVCPVLSEEQVQKSFEMTLINQASTMPKIVFYIIRFKQQDEFIGVTGFQWNQNDKYHAELGLMIISKFHRLKLATEAVNLLIPIGFKKFRISKIFSYCDRDNYKVNNLAEKTGFIQSTTQKDNQKIELFLTLLNYQKALKMSK